MKNRKLAGSICALLLTALGASSAAAQTSPVSIAFTRTLYRALDGTHGSALYRVKPTGDDLAVLAPVTYGYDILGSSWSPSGASVVYELDRQSLNAGTHISSQLYVVDRQGGGLHQITTGAEWNEQPRWAPDSGTIAFIKDGCLATVRADGTDEHVVFCPPRDQGMGSTPDSTLARWTANGKSVLLYAGASEGGLEPEMWYSDVYRVNVTTGLATKLAQQEFDSGGDQLAIAPDGSRGVYDGNPMYAIDFATNTRTPLSTDGYDPMYSPDGSKIAFLKSDTTSPYHTNVYVMNADGSHVRALTFTHPNFTYASIAAWSYDSTRLLVNKIGDDRWLQIIDVRNDTKTVVTTGTADRGAWFHP